MRSTFNVGSDVADLVEVELDVLGRLGSCAIRAPVLSAAVLAS